MARSGTRSATGVTPARSAPTRRVRAGAASRRRRSIFRKKPSNEGCKRRTALAVYVTGRQLLRQPSDRGRRGGGSAYGCSSQDRDNGCALNWEHGVPDDGEREKRTVGPV